MPGSDLAQDTAMNRSMTATAGLTAIVPGGRVRTLAAAAVLSLLLGLLVAQIPSGGRAGTAPIARLGAPTRPGGLPVGAEEPVSAALGAANPAYRVIAAAGGFAAVSPAQGLRVSFGRSGMLVGSGALRFGLGLRAIAQGSARSLAGAVAPRAAGNRVSYTRPGVEEWYVNGPLGVEQGFTVAAAPARSKTGPLTLSMSLSGNAAATLAADRSSIILSRPGGPSLRYGELAVTDARGRSLTSWLELSGATVQLLVDTHSAHYPLRIDPLVQQGGKLTPADAGGTDRFGFSVALSADGSTALVGARRDAGLQGAAWIFTRSGGAWTQQGPKLDGSEQVVSEACRTETAGEEAECGFGRSVALSGDGNTAVIGAPADNSNRGAVWIFTRSGSTWSQQGRKLVAGDETTEARVGVSVALSGEGNTVAIGGPVNEAHRGAAWVFTRSGSGWTQQGGRLTGGEGSGESAFGQAVSLSGDGATMLVGGPGDETRIGAAWVFVRAGAGWAQQGAKIVAGQESGEGRFGSSVALAADGHTALVGARSDEGGRGAAWAFARSGSAWTPQGSKLTAADESEVAEFGYGVALSGDGGRAVIGGPRDNGRTGAAWSFVRSGSTWSQQGAKLTGLEESGKGWFGASVALSTDGATALLGGFHDAAGMGAAWVFHDASLETQPPVSGQQTGTSTTGGQQGVLPTGSSGVLSDIVIVLPPPKLGVSGNLAPESGRILVKLPGSKTFVLLTGLLQVPFGTIVDATHGKVSLTTARHGGGTQTMTFYAGRFQISQTRRGAATSTLVGGDFKACPVVRARHRHLHAAAARTSKKHVVRKLWAEGHGSYSTKGNYASGAVLGTRWLTEDTCEGTLIRVATDKVAVTNLRTHRRHTVTAGHSFLVRAP